MYITRYLTEVVPLVKLGGLEALSYIFMLLWVFLCRIAAGTNLDKSEYTKVRR